MIRNIYIVYEIVKFYGNTTYHRQVSKIFTNLTSAENYARTLEDSLIEEFFLGDYFNESFSLGRTYFPEDYL